MYKGWITIAELEQEHASRQIPFSCSFEYLPTSDVTSNWEVSMSVRIRQSLKGLNHHYFQ